MLKKSLVLGGIMLLLMALLALSGCDNGSGTDDTKAPPEEDPIVEGDLGGIGLTTPTHQAQAPKNIKGTNATVQIDWGTGVSGGTFQYKDGAAVQASVVVKANPNYVFSQTLNEGDILEVFGRVTGDINDDWTLSEDLTELSFGFSYTVAQAVIDISPLKDIKLIAGSVNMPNFIDGKILPNLDAEKPPVNKYVSAGTPGTALTALPAAKTGFQVQVEATVAYGYKWPENLDLAKTYVSAKKVTAEVKGAVLSLTLEYATGLEVINSLTKAAVATESVFVPLFVNPPLGGTQLPEKLIPDVKASDLNFTVEDLKWSGLAEDNKVAVASKSVSTPVKLTPKEGYTFSETTLTADAIAAAINATADPATFNHTVTGIKTDHDLEFTLSYPVDAVQIQPTDMEIDRISDNSLADFYQPRIGQNVFTDLKIHPDAKFTLDSIVWSDESGNVKLNTYTDRKIRGSITLRAKAGHTFVRVNVTTFETKLTDVFKRSTEAATKTPTVKVVATPDETLIFTLTYERDQLNKPIKTDGNTVVADNDALNSGGGLKELFDAISGNTITIPADSTIILTKPPVVPAGKTLEVGPGATLSTGNQPLEAEGNISLGKDSTLTVPSADISGDVSLGEDSTLTISGAADISGNMSLGADSDVVITGKADITGDVKLGEESTLTLSAVDNTITGDVELAKDSAINLTGGSTTIGDGSGSKTTLKGPATGAPEPINVTGGDLNFTGDVVATNVTITADSGTAKINIPEGKVLTIGKGASLVLNSSSTAGTLNGKVVIESGGKIIDENPSPSAWTKDKKSEIEIRYGGVGIMNPTGSPGAGVIFVGTGPDKSLPTWSGYVQLTDQATSSFTLKDNEYNTNGKITLAKNFTVNGIITVTGEFTLDDNLIFTEIVPEKLAGGVTLYGTSNTSKLRIKAGTKIAIMDGSAPRCPTVDAAKLLIPGINFSSTSSAISINIGGADVPLGSAWIYTAPSGGPDPAYTEFVWDTTSNTWKVPPPPAPVP